MKTAQKRKTYLITIIYPFIGQGFFEDEEQLIRLENVTEEYKTAYMDALIEVLGESAVEMHEVR